MSDKDTPEVGKKGFIAGLVAWFIILIWGINEYPCVSYPSCGRGDLLLHSIVSIGTIAPAYLVAISVSIFFDDKK